MTLFEYNLRMKAKQYQLVDKERDLHYSAWLNLAVKSTKGSGNKQKYIYSKFEKFYDYEKAIKNISEEKDIINKLDDNRKELIKKIAEFNNREEE